MPNNREKNITKNHLLKKVQLELGDIVDLSRFKNNTFDFVICLGDSISYTLEKRRIAAKELIRVTKRNGKLIVSADSKLGFLRAYIMNDDISSAKKLFKTGKAKEFHEGFETGLLTVNEFTNLFTKLNCKILETATIPGISSEIEILNLSKIKKSKKNWQALIDLEINTCTEKSILGSGRHILLVIKKL
ncbi:MAG: methyltransferase domain-containing protein [Patescibacteria group bacterium]|nr:methyltransferase domain-containing protein [Patescibacteria group bacterium]MDD5121561.1 methyltransferase domain-containing protein [Patescibacteria group bacterium]MDD5222051.1 methyltransferase domain-containing protein [Patescibacteria group bacterium]MDD5396275.1 methyltransferase domain-containing protein [Patescibacteria group bacterium]